MRAPPSARPAPVTHGTLDARARIGGFQLTETTHAPGMRLPRHAHEDPAITLVLHGGFAETFRSGPVECRRGALLFKPAGEPHTNTYGPHGARSLLIDALTLGEDRRRVAAALYDGVRYFAGGPANRLALRIAAELRQADDAARLAVEGLLLEMLAAAARARTDALGRADPAWLRRAVEYVHAHRRHTVRLAELAAAAEVAPLRLARAFRRRFGETPGAFQRRLRVQWAREALVGSDRPLAEVALEAGFTDQSHFTRVFTRALGVTPGEFRRAGGAAGPVEDTGPRD
jgi:AraC family transcriptional regulator